MPDDARESARPGDPDLTRPPVFSNGAGEQIGPYRLLQKLGEGGMGEVWVAEQREPLRRMVAVKVIKIGMDTRQVVGRFEAERQALAVMDHPAIAKVLDAGATDHGRPYFVMEYVQGEPITAYCDRQRLSTDARLALFVRVCEGVQHAHHKGIIHRDLKPSNVFVTIVDGQPVPKIIDFGIAKATAHRLTEQTVFTELGALIGTPEYMSPEQAEMGGLDIDTRTDIYSLGVLLYELLTGTLPFESKALRERALDEIRRTIRQVEPPRPSTRITELGPASAEAARARLTEPTRLAGQLRGDLDWITMKALDKDRTRRYDSAMGLANDIRRHLRHEPVSAGPPSTVYRTKKFVRRHRFGVLAAAILVALLVAFGVTMTVQAQRIARERDRANREAATTRQVSDFLVGLFKVSDPSEARGRTITAREVLDKGAGRIDKAMKDQPDVQATLMTTMGVVYQGLGLYEEAAPLLENALAIRKRLYGNEDLKVSVSMGNLAALLKEKGQLDTSESLLRQAAESCRKLGVANSDYADILSNLGDVLTSKGSYEAADATFLEELAIRRRLSSDRDAGIATVIHNRGGIRMERSDYAGAETLFREALAMRRRVLGADHPDTATTMVVLSAALSALGKQEEAERLCREALAIRRRILGNEHPSVATNLHDLAFALLVKGRNDEAEALVRESLAIQRKVLPRPHPLTVRSLNMLAVLMLGQEKLGEAESAFRECLAMSRELYGAEHLDVSVTQANLAAVLVRQKQYDEAASLLEGALVTQRKIVGDKSPTVADTLQGYGGLQVKKGNYDQAVAMLRECLEIRRGALPQGHYKILSGMRDLGNCLAKQRRFEEAEELLLASNAGLESAKTQRKGDVVKTLQYTVDLYEGWGKPDLAARYRAKLEAAAK
jgi:eukaryotic-like serine/threonine-protein kinase